jgi:hypothetical protein
MGKPKITKSKCIGIIALLVSTTFPIFDSTETLARTASTQMQCSEAEIKQHIQQLDSGEISNFDALVKCRAGSVPALIEALTSPYEGFRVIAIASLGEIGIEAAPAIPELTKSLTDKSVDVRIIAVDTLEKIGVPSIPSLTKALQTNDNWIVRYSSVDALSIILVQNQDLVSREIIQVFINALEDEDLYVQSKAADALGKMGKNAVPYLINALQHKNAYVREKAADALRIIGIDAKAAIPALNNLLQDENKKVSVVAGYAINAINKSSNKSISSTQNLQNHSNNNRLTRYAAISDRIECRELIVINPACMILDQGQTLTNQGSVSQSTSTTVARIASDHFRDSPKICGIPVLKSIFRWKCPK